MLPVNEREGLGKRQRRGVGDRAKLAGKENVVIVVVIIEGRKWPQRRKAKVPWLPRANRWGTWEW